MCDRTPQYIACAVGGLTVFTLFMVLFTILTGNLLWLLAGISTGVSACLFQRSLNIDNKTTDQQPED